MYLAAAWLAMYTLRRLSCTTSRNTSGAVRAKSRSLPGLEAPKLFTSTSMRPHFCTASSTMEAKVSGLVASLQTQWTRPPPALSPSAMALARSRSRAAMQTMPPSLAQALTMARPMPRVEAVTRITLSVSRMLCTPFLMHAGQQQRYCHTCCLANRLNEPSAWIDRTTMSASHLLSMSRSQTVCPVTAALFLRARAYRHGRNAAKQNHHATLGNRASGRFCLPGRKARQRQPVDKTETDSKRHTLQRRNAVGVPLLKMD